MLHTNLIGAHPHDIGQLTDHHVHTLKRGLLQFANLLFDNGFKSHVGCEKTRSDTVDVLDGVRDLATQFFLVEFHLQGKDHEFKICLCILLI